MDKIREFHYFMLPDYEKEEEYLRRMHRNGWRFTHVTLPGFYHFEKCAPEDVVYRIDFNPQTAGEKENYLRMFEDYGWEYLQDLNEFSYFRKCADASDEAANEIFSDTASKIEMMRRIFLKRMIPVTLIFLIAVLPNIIRLMSIINSVSVRHPAEIILIALFFVLFGLYTGIIVHCLTGFRRLSEKYSASASDSE